MGRILRIISVESEKLFNVSQFLDYKQGRGDKRAYRGGFCLSCAVEHSKGRNDGKGTGVDRTDRK